MILLISLCDIYPVPSPDDFLLKGFSTPQSFEDIGFGCTANPFSGNPDNLTIQLKRDPVAPPGESLSPQAFLSSGSPGKNFHFTVAAGEYPCRTAPTTGR